MSERPINTNDLRDYADRISNPYAQLILDAASELDATRTERNIARRALDEAQAKVKRQREAFSGPAAWLDSWAQHVGNCKGGYVCTCGLTLARTEAAAALKETTDV